LTPPLKPAPSPKSETRPGKGALQGLFNMPDSHTKTAPSAQPENDGWTDFGSLSPPISQNEIDFRDYVEGELCLDLGDPPLEGRALERRYLALHREAQSRFRLPSDAATDAIHDMAHHVKIDADHSLIHAAGRKVYDPRGMLRNPIPATAFEISSDSDIPQREWLYGRHLIRGYVSCTVAAPGTGKSLKAISEALAMTSGKALLGDAPAEPLVVWLFNLEDDSVEMDRRIRAAMNHFDLTLDDLSDDFGGCRLYRDSGRDQPLVLAKQTRDGAVICQPVFEALKSEIKARGVDVLIVDPFVSSHQVSESDNGAIDLVIKTWAKLAHETGCAIELIHHTRKANGIEADVDSVRGASAMIGAVRACDVLNPMSPSTAKKYAIQEDQAWRYFKCADAKGNLAPRSGQRWFKLESVTLANGGEFGVAGDGVGVCTSWTPPEPAELSDDQCEAVLEALDGEGSPFRKDPRAKGWAGHVVAKALGWDVCAPGIKKQIGQLLDDFVESGELEIAMIPDHTRHMRECIVRKHRKSLNA
jgi:hypothetical protein